MLKELTVTIPEFKGIEEDGRTVVYYTVKSTIEDSSWELKKRYTEFDELNDELRKTLNSLPVLPGKTIFPMKKAEDLEKRRAGLERYMKELVAKYEIYSVDYFINFLNLDEEQPGYLLNKMKKVGMIVHTHLAFRDISFNSNHSMLFGATSDPRSISRIDSYISNFSFPWDKPSEKVNVHLTLGNLELYLKKSTDPEEFVYSKLWVRSFKSQVICLEIHQETRRAVIGRDDGHIVVTQLAEEDPKKFSEQFNDKVHGGRVMRVLLHPTHPRMYSIGEDRFLRITNIEAKEAVGLLEVSEKKLTEMVIDFDHGIAYIGDRNGSILVVDTTVDPPSMRQCVKTDSQGAIRGLCADFESNRIFCTCFEDGKIYGFTISDRSNPDAMIKKDFGVRGCQEPRTMKFCPKREELYIGHEHGFLSVYSLGLKTVVTSHRGHHRNINTIVVEKDCLISGGTDGNIKVDKVDIEMEAS